MSETRPTDWERVVLPVLREMYDAEREGRPSRADELLRSLGENEQHAYMMARRISDSGLAIRVSLTMGNFRLSHATLTADGMREIGQWSDGALRGALLEILAAAAEDAPPQERTALRKSGSWLRGVGSDVLVRVLAEYAARQAP